MQVTNGVILKILAVIVFVVVALVALITNDADFGVEEILIGTNLGLALGFLGLTVP